MLPSDQQTIQVPVAGSADGQSEPKEHAFRKHSLKLPIVLAYLLLLIILLGRSLLDNAGIERDDLAAWLVPLLVVPLCFKGMLWPGNSTIVEFPGETLQGWTPALLGFGILSFSIGEFLWTASFNQTGRAPEVPSWADLFYLLTYPCFLVAILVLPARRFNTSQRTRILLDGLIIMTALSVFSWYFLIGPHLVEILKPHFDIKSLTGVLLSLAYPCADLALFYCVLLLTFPSELPGLRRVSALLMAGLLLIILSDTMYGFQTIQHIYVPGTLTDAGWPLGYMLVGLAAFSLPWKAIENPSFRNSEVPAEFRQVPIVWKSLLPYLLVPAVGGLIFYTWDHKGREQMGTGVFIGAAILVLLILIRQVFTIKENNRLYHSLQDAYGELEEKNRQALEYTAQLERLNGELQAMQSDLIKSNEELIASRAIWEQLAITDTMTEIANHRAFQGRLRAEIARAQRYNYPMILLMLDVDNFKPYNDTYGHPAGDQVLREIAALMRETVREGDLVARYGGEEFAAILPQTDAESGRRVAERIREVVESHSFAFRLVTLSIGAAEYVTDGIDAEELISRADQALYAAKHNGKNQVIFFKDINFPQE